jgi:hypothetical protein
LKLIWPSGHSFSLDSDHVSTYFQKVYIFLEGSLFTNCWSSSFCMILYRVWSIALHTILSWRLCVQHKASQASIALGSACASNLLSVKELSCYQVEVLLAALSCTNYLVLLVSICWSLLFTNKTHIHCSSGLFRFYRRGTYIYRVLL